MSSGSQMGDNAQKMRANLRVVETKCLTCGRGFTLGEDVVACSVCGGYHHTQCWDSVRVCQHAPTSQAGYPAAPPPPAGYGPPPQGYPAVSPPPAAQVYGGAPPPAAGGAVRGLLAADEQQCPQCREVIKSGAMKCRFCGSVLNAQLAGQLIPPALEKEINSQANTALWCGIIGLFICGLILGILAVNNGNKAIRSLDQYPQYAGPRGKANTGRILGWIGIVGWALILLIRIGAR